MGQIEKLVLTPGEAPSKQVRISLPKSKSISNRLLIMQALSQNTISIEGLSDAEDTRNLADMLASSETDKWVGEAGTALRFGLAWAAITPGTHILNGTERIRQRPISGLVNALRSIGAEITYVKTEGFAPLKIEGKRLEGGSVNLENQISSQFATAILLIAPYLKGGLKLELGPNQVSKPYVDMTLELMRQAGANVQVSGSEIHVAEGVYIPTHFKVEPDWSAASYFASFKYFNPSLDIILEGLTENSVQGDAQLNSMLPDWGLLPEFNSEGLSFKGQAEREMDSLNFSKTPDLAQTFAVMAAGNKKRMAFTGLKTLRVKETDRIEALSTELKKIGIQSEADDESLTLTSFSEGEDLPSFSTYQDHRMAMAFAPLVGLGRPIQIEQPHVVGKSFPNFWKEVEKLGVKVTRIYSK